MRKYALPLLGILVGQVLLLELVLRAVFSLHQDYDVEMWKYTRDLKQNVTDARGHVHTPNREAELMGTIVRTNSLGLRGPEISRPKPADTYRVLVIGDSFTLGWGVPEEHTYVRQLEEKVRTACKKKVEFINFGIGNYNTEQITAALRTEGLQYSPDLILYGFYWNDAEAAQIEPEGFLARNSYLHILWRKFWVRLVLFRLQKKAYAEHYTEFLSGEKLSAYRKTLQELVRTVRSAEVPLQVALLPELRVKDDANVRAIYAQVEHFFREDRVPVLNLFGRLHARNYGDYWVAPDDPHPNALANREIADGIHEFWGKTCPPKN